MKGIKGFRRLFAIRFITLYYCKQNIHPLNKTQQTSCKTSEIAYDRETGLQALGRDDDGP